MEAIKVVKGLALVFVLIGLTVNSIKEIKKFYEDKTMVSIYKKIADKLDLPLITICGNPPLKGEFFTPAMGFSPLISKPMGNENLSAKWNEEVSMASASIMTLQGQPLNVEVVQTIQMGRCLILDEPQVFNFVVDFGEDENAPDELSVYIHPRSER